LAEAIASALNVEVKNIKDNPDLKDIELVFIVGGIYGGASLPEMLDYIKGMEAPVLKRAALVTSCASGKQGQVGVHNVLEEKGIKVIGEFVCKGSFLFVARKHPNIIDLKEATDFAVKIVG
jgi:hypothetical protein